MATTRLIPFDVSSVTDTSVRNVDFVRGKLNEATQAVSVRDAEITRLDSSNAELSKQLGAATQAVAQRDTELAALRKEVAAQAERNQSLAAALDKLKTATTAIGIQDLVGQVKQGVDRINTEVLANKMPGMLVEGVELEVRGGIDVANGLKITQVPAAALGEHNVSVLRFALRPSSPLKIVDETDTPAG